MAAMKARSRWAEDGVGAEAEADSAADLAGEDSAAAAATKVSVEAEAALMDSAAAEAVPSEEAAEDSAANVDAAVDVDVADRLEGRKEERAAPNKAVVVHHQRKPRGK